MANNFPKFHGITLAAGAVIENLHVERLVADPVPVAAGRLWYNITEKQLKYSSLDAGGAIVIKSFASGDDISSLTTSINAVGDRVTAIEGAYIKKDGSVAFTGDQSVGGFKLTNVATPVAGTDAANKDYVVASIAALGNAFEYVGAVEGGTDAAGAVDLSAQSKTHAGAYYKVTKAGYFKVGSGDAFYANIGDGLVFNVSGTVDKIDNTDSTVAGTANFITVTGSTDTGFTVDLDEAFKGRVSSLETGLAAEISRAQAAESALDVRLTAAEATLVTQGSQIASNAQAIADEATRAQAAESTLTTNLAAEATRAQAAEATLTSDLAAEVTRATAAEQTLTTNLAAEVTRAQAAEQANAQAVADEVTRATAAEQALTAALAAETEARGQKDGELSTLIQNEITRAVGADNTLDGKISAEVARAQTAELVITNNIGDLSGLTTTDKSSVVAAINNLQVLAGGGTDALKAKINAQKFTYASASPALQHVVNHNLNTAFPNVDIRVKGDDGVYRNDIVAFDETSANTITIYLTEARDIKVSVIAADQLV